MARLPKPAGAQSRNTRSTSASDDLVRLWLLRLLIPMGLHRKFITRRGVQDDAIAAALDILEWVGIDPDDFDAEALLTELRRQHRLAERSAHRTHPPKELTNNVEQLANLVGLSETDQRILEFAIIIHTNSVLDDSADWLGMLSSIKAADVIAELLSLPQKNVRDSLSSQGALARTGLLKLDKSCSSRLRSKMDLISENFADSMLSTTLDSLDTLLNDVATRPAPPALNLDDYEHIRESLDILLPYLKRCQEEQRIGVNIFLHGAPGTGKSQLASVISRELGSDLYEIVGNDSDGDPVNGERRLRAFRFAQSFLAGHGKLVLFDEVEDVFNDGDTFFGRKSTAQTRKAWINRMLENNPVPALWLSNSIDCLDPAFVRRFDMLIELPVPPRRQREQILRLACADLLPEQAISRISSVEALTPGVVTRAVRVVKTIRPDLPEGGETPAIEHLISATLVAQGHSPLRKADATDLPAHYDPAYLNVDQNLTAIAEGITRSRSARMCLYGPPGTGKTAYGRWLAEQLGTPLHARRASDILSKYVGGTERNLARVFREAEHDGAVLLLDEVDSFLQDRGSAQRSWEVTGVNEMLTQMESFSGVFIASTNLMSGLDTAALRRFDLKLAFGYLKPDQAWRLFCQECEGLNLPTPEPSLKTRLAHVTHATPGDFAAIRRQHLFNPLASPVDMIAALEAECSLKHPTSQPIGFL